MSHITSENDALVSVIIPAYNAEETIHDTLDSVCQQSYSNLEIIVIDDGSTDNTRRILDRRALCDRRISIIQTLNNGVAAARNVGIAAARGNLIAPIDSDDIWHPQKLALQVEVLRRGGPSMGYVYCGLRPIDMNNNALALGYVSTCAGSMFLRSILWNHVGTGSSLLIRREVLKQVGGYSELLRECGVEGAEDWLIQIQISRNWLVGVVPACLTGYRKRNNSMSSDSCRMRRSVLLVMDIVEELYPDVPQQILKAARARLRVYLSFSLMTRLQFREGAATLVLSLCHSAWWTAVSLVERFILFARYAAMTLLSRVKPRANSIARPNFYEIEPNSLQYRTKVGSPDWFAENVYGRRLLEQQARQMSESNVSAFGPS